MCLDLPQPFRSRLPNSRIRLNRPHNWLKESQAGHLPAPLQGDLQMSPSKAAASFSISIPPDGSGGRDQDAEWCWVKIEDGPKRRIRFHDYPEIYEIPGLYERLFYDELRCDSPATDCG